MSILFQPIKTARCVSDTVMVGFSGGKDSICALDLCCRYFGTVHAYFMYLVPGLSFQEAQLRWYEQRYGLQIHRVPHPMLSSWLKWGVFRKQNFDVPEIDKLADLNLADGIDFGDMGFEQYDVDMLFDGDSRFSQLFVDDEDIKKVEGRLDEVKAARKQGAEKMKERNQAAFYFTVVCKSDEEKADILKLMGIPAFEQFVEGSYLAENIRKGGLGRRANQPPGEEV